MFAYTFLVFLLFFIKEFLFFYFDFDFLLKYPISQQNVNQSEMRTGDKKLSVELYVTCSGNSHLITQILSILAH